MKNVIMLLDNCFDPDIRVYKEAKYLVDNGINVEILCLDKKNKYKDKEEENYEGIKLKRFFVRTNRWTRLIEKNIIIRKCKMIIYFFWFLKFIHKIKKYLKDKEFDIIHCHDLKMAIIASLFYKKKTIVFDMHEYYGNSRNKLKDRLIKAEMHFAQNRAKWIIYVNDTQKKYVKNKNRKKLLEIPNYPNKNTFKTINKSASDKLRISYIGKVRDFLSLSKLIDVENNDNLYDISIYGDGSEYNKILKYAKNKHKESIVKGPYNGLEQSEKLYNNTDILYAVYNTNSTNSLNWISAMPVKGYEAIITLTPIIASKNTIFGDFIEDKKIGFTIDLSEENSISDLLKELIKNPEIVQDRINNIKKIQYEYVWENVVINLDKIYSKIG